MFIWFSPGLPFKALLKRVPPKKTHPSGSQPGMAKGVAQLTCDQLPDVMFPKLPPVTNT